MIFGSVYRHYVNKVESKGRTKQELHQVIEWLTGFDDKKLQQLIDEKATFETFFKRATLICQKLPSKWLKNEPMRTVVMFLCERFDRPEILEQLQIKSVDSVKYLPGAVLWNVEGTNYSKSVMLKLMVT